MDIDLDHLRQWIGRQDVASEVISSELVRRFNATFDMADADLAVGSLAPQLIHFCLAQPAAPTGGLGDDGHPRRGGFLPPVSLSRRMWAGSQLSFHGDLRIGDAVTRASTIADVSLKLGKSGALCFVTVDHQLEVQGARVVSERQTLVYRDAAEGPAAPAPVAEPAARGAHVQAVDPSAALLFRYSALTFNGHRIHYDFPYATQVEFYPGLVVHGPLQATLLIQMAAGIRGARPTRFSFTGRSPLFGGQGFDLHAQEDGESLRLWTAVDGGPLAMTAEAGWA